MLKLTLYLKMPVQFISFVGGGGGREVLLTHWCHALHLESVDPLNLPARSFYCCTGHEQECGLKLSHSHIAGMASRSSRPISQVLWDGERERKALLGQPAVPSTTMETVM